MSLGTGLLALGLLIAPAAASAPPTRVATEDEAPRTGSEAGFRFGLDFGLTGGAAVGADCDACAGMGALGFGLELGYQVDRSWGLFLRPEIGTSLISTYVGSYLMVELTPIRQLSVAGGGGVEGVVSFAGSGFENYGGVAFPLRVAWNFLDEGTWAARSGNNTWRLSLLLLGGVSGSGAERGNAFLRSAISLGYVWM